MRRLVSGLAVPIALTLGAVAFVPAAAADDPLVYVAMGDSFTSGPLVPLPTGDPLGCGQSTRNYPRLVADALAADSFRDVSCGGASVDHFYEPHDVGDGINPPQLDALGPEVDVVTIGITGNDIGFVGFTFDCARLVPLQPPCTPEYTSGGVDQISQRIAAAGAELDQALDDVHLRAPNAEVFVVGYPTSLPDDGVACWPYVPILEADMPYLVAKFKEMNAMIATQAAANEATYVDIYTSSIGHDVCKPPALAWVNGLVVVPLSVPAHPNELSFLHSAPVITSAIQAELAPAAP